VPGSGGEVVQLATEAGVAVERVEPASLDAIARGVPHQGVAAIGPPPPETSLEEVAGRRPRMVVALDGVTDPRNAGAIFRSAEAAGVGALVLCRDRSVSLSPSLVKAAAGSVEWLPVARVTNLARALESLSEAGYWLIGLAADGDRDLFDSSALPGVPLVLVLGSEGGGLRPLVRRACHRVLRIAMQGRTESLNVSVAAAVALFELRRALGAGAQDRNTGRGSRGAGSRPEGRRA